MGSEEQLFPWELQGEASWTEWRPHKSMTHTFDFLCHSLGRPEFICPINN